MQCEAARLQGQASVISMGPTPCQTFIVLLLLLLTELDGLALDSCSPPPLSLEDISKGRTAARTIISHQPPPPLLPLHDAS